MSKPQFTLLPGEQVLLQIETANITKLEPGESTGIFRLFAKFRFRGICTRTPGVFVITDKRLIFSQVKACCCSESEKVFMSYPRAALNGCCSFTRVNQSFCCCNCDDYTIGIGINEGLKSVQFLVKVKGLRQDEQAQALLSSITTLVANP